MKTHGLRMALLAAGSERRLGALLGITGQAVHGWTQVPAARVVAVEKKTGIPREVLRPDLYRRTDDKAARQAWATRLPVD